MWKHALKNLITEALAGTGEDRAAATRTKRQTTATQNWFILAFSSRAINKKLGWTGKSRFVSVSLLGLNWLAADLTRPILYRIKMFPSNERTFSYEFFSCCAEWRERERERMEKKGERRERKMRKKNENDKKKWQKKKTIWLKLNKQNVFLAIADGCLWLCETIPFTGRGRG